MKISLLLSIFTIYYMGSSLAVDSVSKDANSVSSTEVVSMPEYGFTINSLGGSINKSGLHGTILILSYTTSFDDFTPNVNIAIQQFPGTIKEYIKNSIDQCKNANFQILDNEYISDVDALLVYSGAVGRNLVFYARAVKKGDNIFLITATCRPEDWDNIGKKLVQSVMSFNTR